MGTALKKTDRSYTYSDYLTWDDGKRYEIIDGTVYNMSPAPVLRHQRLAGKVFVSLEKKLKGQKCIPFFSPIDVVLSEHDVVQPDVIVVCDPKKMVKTHIAGAPDVIFEILSPSTSLRDKKYKKDIYEKFGVKEYIIMDSAENYAEYFELENGKFKPVLVLGPGDALFLKTLKINLVLKEIFENLAFVLPV